MAGGNDDGLFYGRGMIELGRVTNAQCDRSVPLDTGGAESARGRVPGARRHARALGVPPRFARVVPARLVRPGCVSGSMGPGALPSISSTSPRSNTPPHHHSGHPSYMQMKTGDYIRTSLVENPRFLGDKIKDKKEKEKKKHNIIYR